MISFILPTMGRPKNFVRFVESVTGSLASQIWMTLIAEDWE